MSTREGLAEGWVETTVGKIASSIQYGHTASATDSRTTPRFLRITDIQDGQVDWEAVPSCDISEEEIHKYELRQHDIVFARTGATTGKSFLIRECPRAVFASYLIRLRMKEGIHSQFVQYFFTTHDYWQQIERGKRGIGQPNVNASVLADISLPLPPLSEQHRITEKIDELFRDLDAGVASLERAKANLKRYRASVLKAAVEGRLTEEWRTKHPQTEDGQMLLDRILRERREKWERDQLAGFAAKGKEPPKNWQSKYEVPSSPDTSELPVLPKGWISCTTRHCLFVDVGYAFKSADFANEGIRLLRGENMEPGALRWNDVRYWPTDRVSGYEYLLLREGDIVLAMDRPLVSAGLKIARVKATDLPCLLVQRMARLRVSTETNTAFLFLAMQTPRFISHLLGEQQGTQLPHISGTSIQAFPFPLPPLAEQEEIVRLAEERLSQVDAAEKTIDAELTRSKKLRQGILKQAFEGRLVPQDPSDEPASILLERISQPAALRMPPKTQPKRKASR